MFELSEWKRSVEWSITEAMLAAAAEMRVLVNRITERDGDGRAHLARVVDLRRRVHLIADVQTLVDDPKGGALCC